MTWEQIKERLRQLIEELPWYKRITARAALWALERDFNPQALGVLAIILAVIIGLIIAIIVATCRTS